VPFWLNKECVSPSLLKYVGEEEEEENFFILD